MFGQKVHNELVFVVFIEHFSLVSIDYSVSLMMWHRRWRWWREEREREREGRLIDSQTHKYKLINSCKWKLYFRSSASQFHHFIWMNAFTVFNKEMLVKWKYFWNFHSMNSNVFFFILLQSHINPLNGRTKWGEREGAQWFIPLTLIHKVNLNSAWGTKSIRKVSTNMPSSALSSIGKWHRMKDTN